MLWYKSWLDTRWRFLLGLVLLARVRLRHRRELLGGAAARGLAAARRSSATMRCSKSSRVARADPDVPGLRVVAVVRGQFPGPADAFRGAARQRQSAREVGQRRAVLAGAARVARALDLHARRDRVCRALRARARAEHRDRGARAARRRAIRHGRRGRLRPLRFRRREPVLRLRRVPLDRVQRRLAAVAADVSRCRSRSRWSACCFPRTTACSRPWGGKLLL